MRPRYVSQAGVRSAPRTARVMQLAELAINQTSRSGASLGSMSEIGNVPIFSGSESRFREGPACSSAHDARNDRCDKCNYLRSIKSTWTGVLSRRGYPMRRENAPDRSPRSKTGALVVRSNFKQIICSSALSVVQLGLAVAKAKQAAVAWSISTFYIL